MGKKRFTSKTYLKVLIVVGLLAVIGGGAGTFATFNATTTNASNTFATGTLVLSNAVQFGSTCLSTGGGTTVSSGNSSSSDCDKIFNTTISKPGDTAGANLTLQNVGSLPASHLTLTASSCLPGPNSNEPTYQGTGDLCTKLNFYVQEWTSPYSGAFKCWYPLADGTTCDTNFATNPQFLSSFTSQNLDAGPGLSPALTSGGSRYFTVVVQLPGSAGNSYQGTQAVVDLSWQESQ